MPQSPRLRPLLWFVAALMMAIVPSCAAPVLPLPPPTALVEGPPDMDGMVTVTGTANEGSFVGCLNENTENGVIVRSDPMTGDYSLRIAASSGDDLTLWQFVGDRGGMQVRLVVP